MERLKLYNLFRHKWNLHHGLFIVFNLKKKQKKYYLFNNIITKKNIVFVKVYLSTYDMYLCKSIFGII